MGHGTTSIDHEREIVGDMSGEFILPQSHTLISLSESLQVVSKHVCTLGLSYLSLIGRKFGVLQRESKSAHCRRLPLRKASTCVSGRYEEQNIKRESQGFCVCKIYHQS